MKPETYFLTTRIEDFKDIGEKKPFLEKISREPISWEDSSGESKRMILSL